MATGFERNVSTRDRRQSGAYDQHLVIEQPTRTADAGGFEATVTWGTLTQVWARRLVVRGLERYQSEQRAARVTTMFFLAEYISGLTHDMRITTTGRDGRTHVYDIEAILPAEHEGEGQEVHAFEHAD